MTSTSDLRKNAARIVEQPDRTFAVLARLMVAGDVVRTALAGATFRTAVAGTTVVVGNTALGPLRDAIAELSNAVIGATAFLGHPDGLEVDLSRIADLDPARMGPPPVLEGIPAGMSGNVFEVALAGAARLDALATHAPYLRNVIGHALVELYREGWLSNHADRATLAAAARTQQNTAMAAPRDPIDELIGVRLAAAGLDDLHRDAIEPGHAFMQTVAGIARTHHALVYDAYDRPIDRAIAIVAATRVGLVPVARDDVQPRSVRGDLPPHACPWPLGTDPARIAAIVLAQHRDAEADARASAKPVGLGDLARKLDDIIAMVKALEPQRGTLIRTRLASQPGVGLIWQCLEPGLWFTHNPLGESLVRNWTEVTSGDYGTVVELLIPVTYTAPDAGTDAEVAVDRLVHHALEPAVAMIRQLAAAAASGVSAIVVEADRRGFQRGRTDGVESTTSSLRAEYRRGYADAAGGRESAP